MAKKAQPWSWEERKSWYVTIFDALLAEVTDEPFRDLLVVS